jgi:hypothetical protein
MTHMRILILAATILLPTRTLADERAATPEQLVAKLEAGEKTDDPKALLPFYGGPYRALNEQAAEVLQAAKIFDKALDNQFGADPNCRSSFALRLPPVKRIELKEKKDLGGGKVELTIWTVREDIFESREVAIQENGGWVFVAPVPFTYSIAREEIRTVDGREVTIQVISRPAAVTSETIKAAGVALPRVRAVFARAAKDVAARKYASRQAAVKAVENEVSTTFDQALGKSRDKIDQK